MHIVTYTCDTDALYIVSYHSTWKSHPLDAHFRSYGRRQPSTFSQSECSEQGDPMNAGEFVFPDGYWSTPYCYPGLENLPDGPIILAYYRGAPLPIALLNHVLTLAGPIVPAEGRGLDLPEEAWELLRAWFGELWSRPWHRTSHERVKTSTDLDIPDDGSSAEEDDDAYDLDSVMTSDDDSVRAMHKLHKAQAYMDDESDAYDSEGNLPEEDSEDSRDGENGEDGEDAVGMALNNHASSIATHGYPVPGHSGHDDDPANW